MAGVLAMSAACGTSGRELRDVPEGVTGPTRTEQPGGAAPDAVDSTGTTLTNDGLLTLTSPGFAPGGPLPEARTCGGDSPALSWLNVPAGTAELVLTVIDADTDEVHWAVSAITVDSTGMATGEIPAGAVAHPIDDTEGWAAPCPDDGETHTYEFTLYALTQPLGLAPNVDGGEVVDTVRERGTADAARYTVLTATVDG